MNIQFYINNILADYKELDTLPFLLNVGMRDFLKIGNLEGILKSIKQSLRAKVTIN